MANQDQSDSAVISIRLMLGIFPAVLAMLSAFAVFFYSQDELPVDTPLSLSPVVKLIHFSN